MWIIALLVAVPLIEIGLFIQVGSLIGLWPTLGLVILTAVLGTAVMRSQGARAWNDLNRSIGELRDPGRPLAHGVMIMIAGMLLLLPGFFTDTLGILLLIPPVREVIMHRIASRIQVRHNYAGGRREPHRPPYNDGVIDGDYVVEDEPEHHRPGPPDGPPGKITGGGNSGWTRH